MSFTLVANNENIGDFDVGVFTWSWMLNKCGVGLPIGTGSGLVPGTMIYNPSESHDSRKASPQTNDGFKVSDEQAAHMGLVAKWAAEYQRTLMFVWENRVTDSERAMYERINKDQPGYLNRPACDRLVSKLVEFAAWAQVSGGFEIW